MGQKETNSQWIAGTKAQGAIFDTYISRLKILALSVYKWENLPPTCNERFLEKTLNEDGRAVITDTDFGILNLRAAPSGELNFYENPIEYNCWSIGINVRRKENECVYIRNNWLSRSTYPILTYFAKKLTEIERTILMNIHAQRTPIIIKTDENHLLSMKNMYMQYDGFMPVMYVSDDFDLDSIEVLHSEAPYLADKLDAEKKNTWHEALTYIGISNNYDFKRAQVQTEEIKMSSEHYGYMSESGLIARREAAEKIKDMYGFDVQVYKRDVNDVLEFNYSQEVDNG